MKLIFGGVIRMDENPVWKKRYGGILELIRKKIEKNVQISFLVTTWNGLRYRFGDGDPEFTILIKDRSGLSAISQLDELKICEAYMSGSIDIEGDLMRVQSLRYSLSDTHPLLYIWRRLVPILLGDVAVNRQSIAGHYEFDNDFYLGGLQFLVQQFRHFLLWSV
ncbi:MAG TPA: hypothetical protein PKK43_06755, partial [Spirochaetota bacterium]|nr:hypothetical protein [Spirochaetota bacterium]